MKILMAASEMTPFAATGRMGEDVAALAASLRRLKHEVSVVMPLHRAVRESARIKKTGVKFSVAVGNARYLTEILETTAQDGTQVFLVARDEFFDRSGLYGSEAGDYQDNSARFIYFTKCALELARRMEPAPEILHAHGWHTALAGVFVREGRLPLRTVLTPHGLEYQGNFWSYDFSLTNLPGDYFSARGLEFYGSLNFLKSGILYSDAVVLPSERFAAAAQTGEFGCGLEAVLKEHAAKLTGIPDGQAWEGWNPTEDPALVGKAAFRSKSRAVNAEKLAGVMGWETGAAATIAVFCEASPDQHLLLQALDCLLPHNLRIAVLGDPGRENLEALEVARRKHRGRFTALRDFSEETARLALGAADFFLMPGPANPGSPWLLRALRYGCVPIARQCAGLHQMVSERRAGAGNGFLFLPATTSALADACFKALAAWNSPASKSAITQACLAADFSPQAAASAHEALYAKLLGLKPTRK